MSFSRLRFALIASSSCAALAFACGGISDPTKGGSSERVATVSGALTGTSIPANAHVALVWRTASHTAGGGAYEVGEDVPVVNGKFTMSLAVPAAAYFSIIDGKGFGGSSNTVDSPPSTGSGGAEPAPAPVPPGSSTSGGGVPAFGTKLAPRDTVSGGITAPLSGALAGFVVYVDANGNGKLDLAGEYASSPDQILGGNKELVLVYLKDGGALDYEKMRDHSGILPAPGFNLAWTEGRWLPLNVVELKLGTKQLPSPVCSVGYGYGSSGEASRGGFDPIATPTPLPPPDTATPGSSTSGGPGSPPHNPSTGYPSPTDPNLHCSPDGRSFSYTDNTPCPTPPPPPVGLCSGDYGNISPPCAKSGYGQSIPSGSAPPPGWPCAVATAIDGGAASSSGSRGSDASAPKP